MVSLNDSSGQFTYILYMAVAILHVAAQFLMVTFLTLTCSPTYQKGIQRVSSYPAQTVNIYTLMAAAILDYSMTIQCLRRTFIALRYYHTPIWKLVPHFFFFIMLATYTDVYLYQFWMCKPSNWKRLTFFYLTVNIF